MKLGPGIHHGISTADYLRPDLCEGHSVSGSGLWCIDSESPAHYRSRFILGERDDDTEAKRFGALMHCLLLEGDRVFADRYAIRPDGVRANSNAYKEWAAENASREPIHAEDHERARAMVNAIRAHPKARAAFVLGKPEVTMVWQDRATGIWLKSRPDWLPDSSPGIPNYKTAASAKPEAFARAAFGLGYHVSAALVVEGAATILDRAAVPFFVVQEKKLPYAVTVAVMKDDAIEYGAKIARRSLDTLARCRDAGRWPAYSDDVTYIDMPGWTARELELRDQAGEFQQEAA